MRDRVVIYAEPTDVKRLLKYSKSKGFDVINVFEKSTKSIQPEMNEMLTFSEGNNIKKVIVPSCSIFFKNVSLSYKCIRDFNEIGVSVMMLDNELESLSPDGSVNLTFKVVFDILSDYENQYKQQIKERLQRAYRSYLDKGGRTGRRIGFRKSTIQYRMDYARELNLLREGISLKKCRSITGTSINTLRKLKSMFL